MGNTTVTLVNNMQFVGSADSGHAVVMDAPPTVGGNNSAPKPMELLLMAFGGCTGMDVISILRKKKQNVGKFDINLSAETADEHPHRYTSINIEYVVTGKDISDEAVTQAIQLSLDKYCSVAATIGESAKISSSYRIIHEKGEVHVSGD